MERTPILPFERFTWLLLGLVTCIIFTPIMVRWTSIEPSDYVFHNDLAEQVFAAPAEFFANTPHFLYHVLVALPYSLSDAISVDAAAAFVMVIFYGLLLAAIYAYLRAYASTMLHTRRGLLTLATLVLGLLLLAPLNFFTPETLYFGYYTPHVYHNPTVNIMKPFAVVLFAFCGLLFYRKERLAWPWLCGYALLTMGSIFAKPSFIIVLLPALALLTLGVMLNALPRIQESLSTYILHIWRVINWPILLGGIVLPAVVILYLQTITWTSNGGITFEPFRTQLEWSIHFDEQANQWLLPKLLLSVAFPLLVYGLHFRQATRDLLFNLAWLVYIAATTMSLLLVDNSWIEAGNFGWSAQSAALVLFIAATAFLVRRYDSILAGAETSPLPQQPRLWLSLLLFGLHVGCGIYWYGIHLTQGSLELLFNWW